MTAPELPEPVAGLVEIINRHDDTGFFDAFTEDGAVDDWGRVFTGRESIKKWSDVEFIGSDGVLSPETVTVEGDVVTVVGDWRSNHANGLSSFAFHLQGDRLQRMVIREG